MWNKNYLYFALVIAVAAIIIVSMVNKGDKTGDVTDLFPSPSPTPTPTPSVEPTMTSKPVFSSKPTPTLMFVVEDNYEALALQFDEDGNRRLILDEDCTTLRPSQVVYQNNVKIMIDNTYSTKPHILKIGGVEYSVDAGAWFLTTLSRPNTPARLPIYCGTMELGEIELR